jgi:hypothetical protein
MDVEVSPVSLEAGDVLSRRGDEQEFYREEGEQAGDTPAPERRSEHKRR